jgi:hypothetical protein
MCSAHTYKIGVLPNPKEKCNINSTHSHFLLVIAVNPHANSYWHIKLKAILASLFFCFGGVDHGRILDSSSHDSLHPPAFLLNWYRLVLNF